MQGYTGGSALASPPAGASGGAASPSAGGVGPNSGGGPPPTTTLSPLTPLNPGGYDTTHTYHEGRRPTVIDMHRK